MRRRNRLRSLRDLPRRVRRFVAALFGGSGAAPDEWDEGGVGVREPRRPRVPSLSGAVALEPPQTDEPEVRAAGDEH